MRKALRLPREADRSSKELKVVERARDLSTSAAARSGNQPTPSQGSGGRHRIPLFGSGATTASMGDWTCSPSGACPSPRQSIGRRTSTSRHTKQANGQASNGRAIGLLWPSVLGPFSGRMYQPGISGLLSARTGRFSWLLGWLELRLIAARSIAFRLRIRGGRGPHAGFGAGIGMSLAILRRFWAAAARWNSSRAPFGPRNRSRSSFRIRLRCANSISSFFRSLREVT